jgi:hypothetical protein
MTMQFAQPYQKSIGLFLDLNTAENALNELLKAGFSEEKLSLIPQTSDPHPPIQDTEAAKSARTGAIAGTIGGAVLGFLLGYISLETFEVDYVHPFAHLLGVALAGSGIGAAYTSIMAALAGANVHKGLVESKYSNTGSNYLIIAEGTSEEIILAQAILEGHGGKDMQTSFTDNIQHN